MAFERSKFFSSGEVIKRLGWTQSKLNRQVAAKTFPGSRTIDGRRWFPREATEKIIADLLGKELTPGEVDALACKMLREGHLDGEIVMQLRISIDHVLKLRRSLNMAPTEPATAPRVRRPSAPSSYEPELSGDDFWTNIAKASAARRKKHT